ncbi:MAG: AAA family ATPase [Gammaproteobacteria bacterium]|nr:AAA family ATPase [Gammaproteobacteria bacterium]MCI0590664.1 AAA family ATPase [Gammaproteobacteria bacterium]
MYYAYFGLNQPPFKITPDTRLFFPGGNRGPILEALIYAVVSGEGIVKVVGEVGSGKTMLCRMLEVQLPDNIDVVYLANPSVLPEHIQDVIAFELKLPIRASDSRLQVMQTLQDWLLKRHAENRQVVVFIEEAQSMPVETLEEVRLLSNLETEQNKLLQIVLFGQPELDEMLARSKIRQLKERITYNFKLVPFKPGEIRDYINARLRACGYMGIELFTPAAIREVARRSDGLVRRINILADKALLAAYADNATRITSRHVKTAARDSEFASRWGWLRTAARVTAGFLIVAAILLWAWDQEVWKSEVLSGFAALATSVESHRKPPPDREQGPIGQLGQAERAELGSVPTAKEAQPEAEAVGLQDSAIEVMARGQVEVEDSEDSNAGSVDVSDSFAEREGGQANEVISSSEDLVVARAQRDELREAALTAPPQAVELQLEMTLGVAPVERIDGGVDLGQLSAEEQAALEAQVKELPPEVAWHEGPVAPDQVCTRCTSIIYRAIPVVDADTPSTQR